MQTLAPYYTIEILDGLACALLSAAACCRARSFGAHYTGSIVLGCVCGLVGPLLREIALHGQSGSRMVISALPDDALLGAAAALCAIAITRGASNRLFFWIDSAALGLASCLSSLLSFAELGLAGGLALGLASGMAPGLLRDVSLGDIALLVEKDWYGSAAAIGCMATLCGVVLPTIIETPPILSGRMDVVAVLFGTLTVICLRWWKGRDEI